MQFQKIAPRVTITTPLGEIKIRFYPDDATRHVENFFKLAKMEFYDGTTFHRVVPGFIIQGGDPLRKNPDRSLHESGSPSYWLNQETSDRPHKRGAVGMAKMARESNSTRDPNDNGSQFYICVADSSGLDRMYPSSARSFGEWMWWTRSAAARDEFDNPLKPITMTMNE